MALTNRFKISMLDVFPHGAYLVSEVEPVRDFDKSSGGTAGAGGGQGVRAAGVGGLGARRRPGGAARRTRR